MDQEQQRAKWRDKSKRRRERAKALRETNHVGRMAEIAWVAQHLDDDPAPNRTAAPTASAWSLFQWARTNSDKFWEKYLGQAPKEKADEQGQQQKDDERRIFRLFEALERERPDHRANVYRQRESAGAPGEAQIQA